MDLVLQIAAHDQLALWIVCPRGEPALDLGPRPERLDQLGEQLRACGSGPEEQSAVPDEVSIRPSLTPAGHRTILPAMHHIGILAHSADGAALCFLEMVRDSARRLTEHLHPEITQRAKAEGRRCVGLLGTRWTMAGPVYPRALARAGLAMKTPPPEDRELVNEVIFCELCQGVIRDESRAEYLRIIEGLKRSGCDVVALSCTELPLLVTPEVSPLPTLDSTRLLARAAVAVACGDSVLPAWRGGPFA